MTSDRLGAVRATFISIRRRHERLAGKHVQGDE
jgi:hypothetical protein